MTDVGRHPRITLHTLTEVAEVQGSVGNFNVKLIKRARYIDENECTSCGDCADVCPVVRPDEYNVGLSTRKAIYIPFPQAIPASYAININECLGHNPAACTKCVDACQKNCINFNMSDEEITENVGTIIVATGAEPYNPKELDEYSYTRYQNVLTSIEFERLVNAGGPTLGKLIRPNDRRRPVSVGFIQCVGSRSLNHGGQYCSNICCMNTIKSTLLLKEHYPDIDIKVFYIDIRAFGKGFEELYLRSRRMGVHYLRGLPGSIQELPDGSLRISVENTVTGKIEQYDLEMLVLALGLQPSEKSRNIQEQFGLQLSSDGFFLEAHPKLLPVDSATRGIFFAGCAEGPKDIKESVTQASAAASRAIRLMHSGEISIDPIVSEVIVEECKSCGKCVEVCPYNAITVDTKKKTPAVITTAACAGCGTCAAECPFGAIEMNHYTDTQITCQIDAMLEHNSTDKILVFACNWCSYAGADLAGTSRLQYPANARIIRTMCSGRVDEKFIWHGFRKGAPIVLVSGCHIGDCHYIDANHWTVRRIEKLRIKLEKMGIRSDRLQLEWVSSAEGIRWAEIMRRMEELRKGVSLEEIENTIRILQAIG